MPANPARPLFFLLAKATHSAMAQQVEYRSGEAFVQDGGDGTTFRQNEYELRFEKQLGQRAGQGTLGFEFWTKRRVEIIPVVSLEKSIY